MIGTKRLAAMGAAALLAVGFGIAGAGPASADQVWHQAVGRASADAPCPTNTPAESAAGWSNWAPSWAKWANGDKGGYVCQRDITWAKDTPSREESERDGVGETESAFPSAGCVFNGFNEWFQFGGSYFIPAGSPSYLNDTCTVVGTQVTLALIFTPAPSQGPAFCLSAFGPTAIFYDVPIGGVIYECLLPPA